MERSKAFGEDELAANRAQGASRRWFCCSVEILRNRWGAWVNRFEPR